MFPATKFRAPNIGTRPIARPELIESSRSGIAGHGRPAAVMVRAPAGYGKTTAVVQWLHGLQADQDTPRYIWVSLDEDDDDLEGLWQAVVSSATRAGLVDGPDNEASGAGGTRAGLILPLLDKFAASPSEWILVLDNANRLTRDDAVASLDWFLAHAPGNVTTVVITRTRLVLPTFQRLRARGDAAEITAAQLCFTSQQVVQLLHRSFGLDLRSEDLSQFVGITEGWPAAVVLVGSALAHGIPLTGIGAFRADTSALDALVNEGLAGTAFEDQQVLQMLSVFERFDAATLDAVVRNQRAWPLAMEVAERTGLIASVDSEGRWWYLHHLVRERLTAALERHDPKLRRELHRRAARLLEWEHDLAGAMHHLLGAEDYDAVADILSDARASAAVPRQSLGMSWLDRIPCEMSTVSHYLVGFPQSWRTGNRTRHHQLLQRRRRRADRVELAGCGHFLDVCPRVRDVVTHPTAAGRQAAARCTFWAVGKHKSRRPFRQPA